MITHFTTNCQWINQGLDHLSLTVLGPLRDAAECPLFSEVPKATHYASHGTLKGVMSAQKAFMGPSLR